MEITHKQRVKIAQKQKTNPHIQDYCALHLYKSTITPKQYQNLMFIHDEPAEVLRRTYFIQDKPYILSQERDLYAKTQKHGGWTISPWQTKNKESDK